MGAGLTMFYIKLLLYNIIKVTVQLSQSFFTKCIGYNTKYIDAVRQ